MVKQLGRVWLGVAVLSMIPAIARSEEADKEQVLALSRTIDAHIAAKQKEAGVIPAGRADESTYFRRLNLDLVGRIPTLTDHRDFLDNPDPDKRWQWVDRFLSDETYAKHFAGIWRSHILGNNLAQQFGGLAPGFELWLQEKLKSNVPYNRLVHEILTSGTNSAGMLNRGGVSASPAAFYFINENKPENLAAATTRKFLGVKLECAQCHAHPFAHWTRDQFWEFAAFFSGVQPINNLSVQPIPSQVPKLRQIKIPGTSKTVKAKFLSGKEPTWKDNDAPNLVLADWVTSADNPYFAKAAVDQVWGYFFGVSLLEPIMEPSDDSPIVYPELLDEMARQFAAHNFDLKFLIKAIVHTDAYQRASTGGAEATKDDYTFFTRMPVRGLTPEQLFDSVAEATHYEQSSGGGNMYNVAFNNPPSSPRAQFMNKFTLQERRHETQTSILQALFVMNGKFLADRIKPENNLSFNTLLNSRDAATGTPLPTAKRIESLYLWVLARLPRPEETERLARYIDSGGPLHDPRRAMGDVYWALLNSAEFMLNH